MFLLDSFLIGGLKFVLNQVAAAVDAELDDETILREELLATRMRFELGEIGEDEYAEIEGDLLKRLREIRQARGEVAPSPGEFRVTGAEAEFAGEEHRSPPS
jgi:hypothetical protein